MDQDFASHVAGIRRCINGLKPQPGCPFFVEREQSPFGQHAWDHGTRALVASCDNMVGLVSLRKGAIPTAFAHFSLLRATVDGASLTRWLFDPKADGRVRAQRTYRAILEDLNEMQKAEDADPDAPAVGTQSVAELRAEIDAQALAFDNLQPTPRDKSKYSVLAARYAGILRDVDTSGKWLYAVLSAAAHGRPWGIQLTERRVRGPSGDAEMRLAPHAAGEALAVLVLRVLRQALEDAERHAGIDHTGAG